MNKGVLTVGIIFLALIALSLLQVLTNYSTGSELDYYLVKETADAAMQDAVDLSYYRTCGLFRIDKEKFVESFLYRFANNVDTSRGYQIGFYDINEVPPKVSVKVDSLTTLGFKSVDNNKKETTEAANITTNYDAILEANYLSDINTEVGINTESDMCKALK